MLDTGCWILDTGYLMLDKRNRSRVQCSAFRVQDSGVNPERRTQDGERLSEGMQ